MAENDYPTLNGVAPSWADLRITVRPQGGALLDMADVASIDWSDTVEVGDQRGPGPLVRKRTTGQVSQEASFTLYKTGAQRLLRELMALAPPRGNQLRVSLVHFNIVVQQTPPGSAEIFETRIKGCRLLGRSISLAEGTDATQVEIALNPIQIVDFIDGKEVVLL